MLNITNIFSKNNNLDFTHLNLMETSKHVHKLHPNKGKFIPQLAEHYLKNHFKKGDTIIDPFLGSGTTIVECKQLGINTLGVDISAFHTLLAKTKVTNYNPNKLEKQAKKILNNLDKKKKNNLYAYENNLKKKLRQYNKKHNIANRQPSNENKLKLANNFAKTNTRLAKKYKIKTKPNGSSKYVHLWYTHTALNELRIINSEIEKIKDKDTKDLFKIVLSRTARSTRATTHQSVTSPRRPTLKPYYCEKHHKICTPPLTAFNKFAIYLLDSINRVKRYDQTNTHSAHTIITADSKTLNLKKHLKNKKLDGVFTSPPYVGQINYHKQHLYAFELLELPNKQEEEIGPLSRGRGLGARKRYVAEMTQVLINIKPHLKPNASVFVVANDRFRLFPKIIKSAGYKIVSIKKRKVSRRSEGDQTSYTETIFHLTPGQI